MATKGPAPPWASNKRGNGGIRLGPRIHGLPRQKKNGIFGIPTPRTLAPSPRPRATKRPGCNSLGTLSRETRERILIIIHSYLNPTVGRVRAESDRARTTSRFRYLLFISSRLEMVESMALVLLAYAALPAKLAQRFPVLLPLKVKEVLFTETSTIKTESAAFLPTLLFIALQLVYFTCLSFRLYFFRHLKI